MNEDGFGDLDLDVDKSNSLTNPDPSTQHSNEIANSHINGNKKSTRIENNKIIYFLEHIYKNCKKLGITPNIMTGWIEDLLSSFHNFTTGSDKDNGYDDTNNSDINNAVEKKKMNKT